MTINRRLFLLGSAYATFLANNLGARSWAAITVGEDTNRKQLLVRLVRTLYPHDQIADGPYLRTSEAIVSAANQSIGQALMFARGLDALDATGFATMDEAAAVAHLKSIEGSEFFGFVRSKAVVALYNDPEVWKILGYEGPSYDQGGYLNRGFNDLDWLPEPRITQAKGAQ